MELKIVNPDPRYSPVRLVEPPSLGYIHVAAAVAPPPQPGPPFPRKSRERSVLLARLKALARELEQLDAVEKATVYRAAAVPPLLGYAKERADEVHVARYDVVVLIETSSPEVIADVRDAEPYQLLVAAVTSAAKDVHVMAGHCPKRAGDVDKTRPGLFLFNYFVADDAQVAFELWDHLTGWFVVEAGLDNSTLLVPLEGESSDYLFVNHARWDHSLPRLMVHLFAKKSFRTYVQANLDANRVGAMPILYRLA